VDTRVEPGLQPRHDLVGERGHPAVVVEHQHSQGPARAGGDLGQGACGEWIHPLQVVDDEQERLAGGGAGDGAGEGLRDLFGGGHPLLTHHAGQREARPHPTQGVAVLSEDAAHPAVVERERQEHLQELQHRSAHVVDAAVQGEGPGALHHPGPEDLLAQSAASRSGGALQHLHRALARQTDAPLQLDPPVAGIHERGVRPVLVVPSRFQPSHHPRGLGGRGTFARVDTGEPLDEGGEPPRYLAVQAGEGHQSLQADLGNPPHGGLGALSRTGDGFVEQNPRGIQVDRPVEGQGGDLLGGHEGNRPEDLARGGGGGVPVPEVAHDAEVEDGHVVVCVHQHVGRLQVAVDDACVVERRDRLQELAAHPDGVLHPAVEVLVVADHLEDVAAMDPVHGEPQEVSLDAGVVHPHHPGQAQRSHGLELAKESPVELGDPAFSYLDGELPILTVARPVHGRGGTEPEGIEQGVRTQAGPPW